MRGVRDVAARRRPARQRGVVAARVGAHDAAQRLRQQREAVHRRQRREDDVARAAPGRAASRRARRGAHRAPRRHLVDHVVDAGDDDRDVGAERRSAPRAGRGRCASSARSGRAAPTRCGRPQSALQRAHEVAGDRLRPGARRRRRRPTNRRRQQAQRTPRRADRAGPRASPSASGSTGARRRVASACATSSGASASLQRAATCDGAQRVAGCALRTARSRACASRRRH